MNTQSQGQAAAPAGIELIPASGGTIGPLPWKLGMRIGFRFSLAYLVLYAFPFPLDSLPFGKFLATHWEDLWRALVPWFGEHVLHLSYKIVVFGNGSGDTTFGYVKILCYVVLATLPRLYGHYSTGGGTTCGVISGSGFMCASCWGPHSCHTVPQR